MATEPREQLSELAQSAEHAAEQTIGRRKEALASDLGTFAGALRNAAKESGANGPSMGQFAEWAADSLERASSALQTQDLRSMLRAAEDFARKQPVTFFFAAAAVGFLATRFIKAGTGTSGEQPEEADMSAAHLPTPADYEPLPMNPL